MIFSLPKAWNVRTVRFRFPFLRPDLEDCAFIIMFVANTILRRYISAEGKNIKTSR